MPLSAIHQDDHVIDLTTAISTTCPDSERELSPGVRWSDIYKTRPRARLTCRECSHGLHPKISRGGLRFFAHDPNAPECGLAGESLAHRLLKVELASAIRRAGWHAELEVAGDGWRADVLATSPDGNRRMAWEAQLAAATAADLQERTARMAAESVAACWVTDKDRPFIGHVPSIRIQPSTTSDETSPSRHADRIPAIVDGLGAFDPAWCRDADKCSWWNRVGQFSDQGPCGGHGRWARPPTELSLSAFVRHVLARNIALYQPQTGRLPALGRHDPGPMVWTTRPHVTAERKQLHATDRARRYRLAREQTEERRREDRARHLAATVSVLARQDALRDPAVELVGREVGGYVGVRDATADWAMGVPLFVHDLPRGVIAPVANRIRGAVRDRLAELTLFVATSTERDRVAKATVANQRIVLFEVEVDDDAFVKRLLQARSKHHREI